MPNYYFNVRNPRSAEHVEPRECPDLRSALIEANTMARSLIGKQLRRHRQTDLHGSLDVENELRQPVARIMLAELARQLS